MLLRIAQTPQQVRLDQTTTVEEAVRAARHWLAHGQLDPSLTWQRDTWADPAPRPKALTFTD